MRLERLQGATGSAEAPASVAAKELKIEVAGGKVELSLHPVRAKEATGNPGERLEAAILAWNVTDDNGELLPVNGDAIHSLAPGVKETLLDAILARSKAKAADKPEKPPEKPAEPAHGSFEPVAGKETKSGLRSG